MSVLIDATPIRLKKKDKVRSHTPRPNTINLSAHSTQAPAKTKKAKKTKKSAVELSKDEETIKRLKVPNVPDHHEEPPLITNCRAISHSSTHVACAKSGPRNFKILMDPHSRLNG
jgi:hypothetical protein